MATQLAEAPGDGAVTESPNAEVQTGGEVVNKEAEARKMGWVPKDEFKGDPDKHIDADTFYERSQTMMPILKAANKKLLERMDRMDREMKKASEFFSQAETRAYERARTEIRAEMERAVEDGDLDAHRKAADKLDKLEVPTTTSTSDEGQRAEEFANWMTENRWYANDAFRAFADAEADKIARTKKGFLERSDLDEVAKRVKDKFGTAFPDEFGIEKPRTPRNAVDGGGQPAPRKGSRTFNDLPADAQRMCDKWVGNGLIKSREDYVKSYKWD